MIPLHFNRITQVCLPSPSPSPRTPRTRHTTSRESPASSMAAGAPFPACMEGERVYVSFPYYDVLVSSLERREEEFLTVVKLETKKVVPPHSMGEAFLLEGHGLSCHCSVDSMVDLTQEQVLMGFHAMDCQVRPCNACGTSGLPISTPPFSESFVGKPMRFCRLGPKNVTEAAIEEVQRGYGSLSIVRLKFLAAPPPLCMGDLLVLGSLDGQQQWEADVRYYGDPMVLLGCNEQRSLENSVTVHVRHGQAPKLLPPKFMIIVVMPARSSETYPTNNGRGAASQRRANKATLNEAQNGAKTKIKIGIDGYGSIGGAIARVALESQDVELVAINDPFDLMTCLFRDSGLHDHWLRSVFKMKDSNTLMFGEKEVTIFRIKEPDIIPWNRTGAEYIIQAYDDKSSADDYKGRNSKFKHYNDSSSNANPFENCLSPLAKILHGRLGTVKDASTTCRAPVICVEPQNSNAAKAIGEVLPQWKGMHSGLIFQVPAVDASPIDIIIEIDKYKDYRLIPNNTKPSFGFGILLGWCVEMTRQIPQVRYCLVEFK